MSHRTTSYYWHDYETWGARPSVDRAAQFAGLRTDLEFNVIGKPLVVYAKPADDFLPQPGACMVTGISPQKALEEGLPEADFFRFIHDEMSVPGTCSLGYNTLRFDDEVTRYGLYRNFFEPYEREWKNGNSRWDMIDVVRLTRALRPEGIQWPEKEDGVTSFRLEDLTAANGIEHAGAHDALVDVQATIGIAKLIRDAQPRLFDYVSGHRDKQALSQMLNIHSKTPVLHVSSRYPARLGCIAAVLPLALHSTNRNSVIVYDLRSDPSDLLALDADQIRERMYTRTEDLPKGVERIAIKEVHVNKAAVVVPMNTLTAEARERWQMDAVVEQQHLEVLLAARNDLRQKLAEVFSNTPFPPQSDPDRDLYGAFLSDHDKRLSAQIRVCEPACLQGAEFDFEAPKLAEMLFRYRARNWPETLSRRERERWDEFRVERIMSPKEGEGISLQDYRKELSRLAVDVSLSDERRQVVDQLIDWPNHLGL